jgi:hypothetical protein
MAAVSQKSQGAHVQPNIIPSKPNGLSASSFAEMVSKAEGAFAVASRDRILN